MHDCLVDHGFFELLSRSGKSHLQQHDNIDASYTHTYPIAVIHHSLLGMCVWTAAYSSSYVASVIGHQQSCWQMLQSVLYIGIIHMLVCDLTGQSSTLPAARTSTRVRFRSCPGTAQLFLRWSWQVPPPLPLSPPTVPYTVTAYFASRHSSVRKHETHQLMSCCSHPLVS